MSFGSIPKDLVSHSSRCHPRCLCHSRPRRRFGEGASFGDGDNQRSWRSKASRHDGWLQFEPADDAMVFASCRIRSLSGGRVAISLRVDDYARIMLNGEWTGGDRLIRTSRNFEYQTLNLLPGWDTVVVAVINHHGGLNLQFQIVDSKNHLEFASGTSGSEEQQ